MADKKKDPFADAYEKPAAIPPSNRQLNPTEAVMLQNVYDDNPKLRAAYLKKHGFEMNPKDENEYRPLGAGGDYYEVDPGFVKQIKQYGIKGFADEAMSKVKNNILPTASMAAIGGAEAAGALEGLAAGPLSPAVSSALAVSQGAAMSASIRAAKHSFANYMADSNIPADKEADTYRAFMDGVMPGVMRNSVAPLASAGLNKLKDVVAGKSQAALRSIQQMIGRGASVQALTKVAENPELMHGVGQADQMIKSEYERIHGIKIKGLPDPTQGAEGAALDDQSKNLVKIQIGNPEQVPKDSLYGQRLAQKMADRDVKIAALDQNPQANFTTDELIDPLVRLKNNLIQKSRTQVLNGDEKAALGEINNRLGEARKIFGEKDPLTMQEPTVKYSQGRSWLSSLQQDLFTKDMNGNYLVPGAKTISQAIGGAKEALGGLIDQKAYSAGSSLPQTNAEISNILTSYNATKLTTPQQIAAKFLPGTEDWKSIVPQYHVMDQVLGTNSVSQFEDLATQNWIKKLTQNSTSVGSSNVNAALGEAASTAIGSSAADHVPVVGPLVRAAGAVKAGVQAYKASQLADPTKALNAYIDQYAANKAPISSLNPLQRGTISGIEGIQAASPVIAPATGAAISSEATKATLPDQSSTPATPHDPFAAAYGE